VMEHHLTDPAQWAQTQFGGANLGDKRRTRRLVRVATQVAKDSMASLPNQTETWGDLKAAYRLFDEDDVSFDAVATPHWELTRNCGPGRWLILNDTTELDFGPTRQIEGLGPVGSGTSQGFLLHNALMLEPASGAVHGLAGQELGVRKPVPKNESRTQRRKRPRESEVWGRVIEAIGPPRSGAQFVHVMDRGADDFEIFCRTGRQLCDWVVRLKSPHRRVLDGQGVARALEDVVHDVSACCCYSLRIRARPGQSARTARVEVSHTAVTMLVPRQPAESLKSLDPEPIAGWVVNVHEIDPPTGVVPVEWLLFTSLKVETAAEALEIIAYYEARWTIEEFHKALKTGCNVEQSQLQTAARLAPLTALLSVQAVRLIQLKAVARAEPDRPTEDLVPHRYVQTLARVRKLAPGSLSRVRDFFRTLAKLGGFLGRKGDGEPGWLTIWRGWEKLYVMIRGVELMSEVALE
jgi:hypothetical protein